MSRSTGSRLRILVSGLVAQYPLGGVAWDYLQYAAGLARLGHDVWYLEDTGQWPYDPRSGGTGTTCDFNVAWLAAAMERFGLADRWAYRFPWGPRWFGLSEGRRREIFDTVDLVVNVSGVLRAPERFPRARLAYVDSDPVFTQVKLARGQPDFRALVDAHAITFTFGESLSIHVPETGHDWLPTRQPVLLDEWRTTRPPRRDFTTVMNWTSYGTVEYEGVTYGQKDVEFRRFLDLPSHVPETTLELALAEGKTSKAPRELLRHRGWRVVDPDEVCPGPDTYRTYIQESKAEWSVAKHGYVEGRSGWFSCRSACYLAAGRPVIVQRTGFEDVLPSGEGILAFECLEEAIEGIREVERDYERHAASAREIAEAFFGSDEVLRRLVERAMHARPSRESPIS